MHLSWPYTAFCLSIRVLSLLLTHHTHHLQTLGMYPRNLPKLGQRMAILECGHFDFLFAKSQHGGTL
jgi:hypothetical protein